MDDARRVAEPGDETAPDGAAGEQGRGREADKPSQIPARGWKDIVLRVYRGLSDDRILANAAAVTFYAILALFPALAALVSIYGLFTDPSGINQQIDALSGVLPGGGLQVIHNQMTRLTAQPQGALSIGLVIGILVSLWSANGGMKALFDALNVVYGERERRGFFALNAVTLAFTLGMLLFVIVALVGIVAIPVALHYLPGVLGAILNIARWPVMALVVAVALALIYRWGPSRGDAARWRWLSWGSVLAALGWLGVSALFSYYAANFGTFNKTYGSLGAAIGFMLWIWLSSTVILLGGKLNAEIEHQTTRDTTRGKPEPLGRRGAHMADTVGAAQD